LLDRRLVAETVEHDVGAVLGERTGDGEADAGRRAGDERGFSLEHANSRSGGAPRKCAWNLPLFLLQCNINQEDGPGFPAYLLCSYNRSRKRTAPCHEKPAPSFQRPVTTMTAAPATRWRRPR